VKTLVRRFLTQKQRRALAELRDVSIGMVAVLLSWLLKLLPQYVQAALHERWVTVAKMDYASHEIYLHIDSTIEYWARRNACMKEPETVRWIEEFIGSGEVVFDVGANVGSYSLLIEKHTGGHAKVYAFEPTFANFAQLNRNIHLNRCGGYIIPLCIALASQTGIVIMNYSSLLPGAALHAVGTAVDNKGGTFKPAFRQPVMSYRMDDLVGQFVEQPNHIKLDVDGIELDVLKGAERTLADPALKTILVELEPGLITYQLTIDFLKAKGFRIQSFRQHGTGYLDTGNYLFVRASELPSQSHAEV